MSTQSPQVWSLGWEDSKGIEPFKCRRLFLPMPHHVDYPLGGLGTLAYQPQQVLALLYVEMQHAPIRGFRSLAEHRVIRQATRRALP